MNRYALSGLTMAAVLLGAGIATPAAQAAKPTSCAGAIGAVSVGSLTVPSGATCTLDGTRVGGNLTVSSGATLDGTAASVRGAVRAQPASTVTLRKSRVGGTVRISYADAVTVSGTAVRGGVVSRGKPGGIASDPAEPNNAPVRMQILDQSVVSRALLIYGTELELDRSTVRGNVRGTWNHRVTVTKSTVRGTVNVKDSYGQVHACGATFHGDVTLTANRYGAFLGEQTGTCAGNVFRRDLTVNEVRGVRLYRNTVHGKASGVNPPFMAASGVLGGANIFRGGAAGDFVDPDLRN